MREEDYRRSDNVEDRRGMRGPGGRGGGGGMPIRTGGIGIGGLIIIGIIAMLLGVNPLQLLGMGGDIRKGGGGSPAVVQEGKLGAPQDEEGARVSSVLATTEDVWKKLFAQGAMQKYGVPPSQYPPTKLVFFDGSVASACGGASAAMGPFYCPADSKVYIDLSFFRDLQQRFGAPGDFAQAYVIAHEVGHHIQNLTGVAEQVARQRGRLSQSQSNRLQVMMELQADCFAGVWGYYTKTELGLIEAGDLEEALNASNAIGDDRLQKQSRGYVTPDSFTHGSSEQRKRWFSIGYERGDPAACDTFNARDL
jgi:predicted metalloprotease